LYHQSITDYKYT